MPRMPRKDNRTPIHDKSTQKCRQTPNVFDEDTTKNQTR